MTAQATIDVTIEVLVAARDFTGDNGAFTVADLVTLTGRSETTVRKAINQGVIDGTVGKADGRGQFMFLPADAFEADLPRLENPPENTIETPVDEPLTEAEGGNELVITPDEIETPVTYTPVELIETTNALLDEIEDREQTDDTVHIHDVMDHAAEIYNAGTDAVGNLVTESDDDDDDDDDEVNAGVVQPVEAVEAVEAVDAEALYRVEVLGAKGVPVYLRRFPTWVLNSDDELEQFKSAVRAPVAGYSAAVGGKRRAILELQVRNAAGETVCVLKPQELKRARRAVSIID